MEFDVEKLAEYINGQIQSNSRINELASRVDEYHKMNDDSIYRLSSRLTALEAARQSPPTPSAPVAVTDAMVDAFGRCFHGSNFWEHSNRHPSHKRDIVRALEAAFAARDREAGQ